MNSGDIAIPDLPKEWLRCIINRINDWRVMERRKPLTFDEELHLVNAEGRLFEFFKHSVTKLSNYGPVFAAVIGCQEAIDGKLRDKAAMKCRTIFDDFNEEEFNDLWCYVFNTKIRFARIYKLQRKIKLSWYLYKNPIESCKRNNWFQCLIKTIRALLGLKSHLSGTYWDFPTFSNDGYSQGQGRRH